MTTETILSLGTRKIVKWGQGYVVFLTKEAKEFGWNDKTKVSVSGVSDSKGNSIVIRKAK
jgi:hypothetical protein